MNNKKALFVIAALFIFFSCSTKLSTKRERSLLWKISGNGLSKPSYLFGTHHLVPISFLDSVWGIEAVLEETEQTVGELDLSHMAEMQMKIMREGIMPPGVTYATLLSPNDTVLLDSMLRAVVGVGLDQLGRLKPAMLSNLISISLYRQYYPSVASEKNLDLYFQEEALKRSHPVVGLETAEEQINILLNLQPLERQAEMLLCMVKNPALLKKQMDQLQTAYYAQDLEALLTLPEKETPGDPCPFSKEEKQAVNEDRNRKWLAKLPLLMEENASLIAVGCLHLPGDDGLINGLRKLGYSVEAVKQ